MKELLERGRRFAGRLSGVVDGESEEPILRYEVVFCIFMAASIVLCRENPDIVYPDILYLFLLLLALNWAAVAALRRLKSLDWASAVVVAGNLAVITAILEYSGGAESNLWVLFLLPVYTACMILGGREVFLVTTGTISFNSVYVMAEAPYRTMPLAFGLAIKAAVLVFAAASTWRIAHRDRASRSRLRAQVAELERLEGRLVDETRRARQSDAAAESGIMMVGVAHDVSNVFWVVENAAEVLLDQVGGDPAARAEADRILRSVSVGRGILAHLLQHVRQEKLRLEPLDLNAALEGVLDMAGQSLVKAGVAVEKRLAADLPRVAGSKAHLERVFLNLVSNARDAMKAGGTLRIRTEAADPVAGRSPEVRVIVADTGPGLPAEVRAKIFTPFVTTKRSGQGTGLGLFLCREIVNQHNGAIRAENPAAGGARFTVTLPTQ
ncbi:MAG: ATP-binding protein [Elusimicrobiota bacterium]